MTAVYVFAYVLIFAAAHNLLDVARLRWQVILRARGPMAHPRYESRLAALVLVAPVLLIAISGYLTGRSFATVYDAVGVIALLCVAVGVPGAILMTDTVRALQSYAQVRAIGTAKGAEALK